VNNRIDDFCQQWLYLENHAQINTPPGWQQHIENNIYQQLTIKGIGAIPLHP
jgi:hypothetical protein